MSSTAFHTPFARIGNNPSPLAIVELIFATEIYIIMKPSMKSLGTFLVVASIFVTSLDMNAQSRYSGFYKDIFMDCGVKLNSYPDLPAANYLGLTIDVFSTDEANVSQRDSIAQKAIFAGCEEDSNGALLYPDGSPRYRLIYVNGGKSTSHGKSLGKTALDNIRKFVANGGSYVGTCAGAFFCSQGVVRDGNYVPNEFYSGVWPGYTVGTKLEKSATGMFIEKRSPLLKYYSFDGRMEIDSVRHNGGCYAYEENLPKGTEILLRYDGDTLKLKNSIDRKASAWAWKESEKSGRVVVIGSHPERMISGSRLELFSAMIRYALDGNGKPCIKHQLQSGDTIRMVCSSRANNPSNARIGDRQFHHFCIDVPKGAKEVTINLGSVKGWSDVDLYLFAGYGEFAWNDTAQWKSVNNGVGKILKISDPKAGKLYISVFCATTVDSRKGRNGDAYCGRTDILNGVPYTICAAIEM